MSRPPLPLGTWGSISTSVERTDDKGKPAAYRAKAKFRDHDGRIRPVSAFGKTKTAAERALLKKLQNRARTNQSGELTAMHKMNHLLDLWEKRFEALVADGTRSPTSLDTYRRALKNHVRPALGELRIGEATTPRIDTVLTKIKTTAGAATAKSCRAIISGAMKLAVRYGAISVNPVREVDAIEAKPKNPPRALTAEEVTLLRKSLAADDRAVQADLPDLVTFMLGTGVRSARPSPRFGPRWTWKPAPTPPPERHPDLVPSGAEQPTRQVSSAVPVGRTQPRPRSPGSVARDWSSCTSTSHVQRGRQKAEPGSVLPGIGSRLQTGARRWRIRIWELGHAAATTPD